MKFLVSNYHKRCLYSCLILTYAFELLGCVLSNKAADHLEAAEKFLNANKFSDALPHFHEAINNDPSNYLTYFKRATVFLALNRPKSALDDLNKALELNKDFTSAISQRANLHVKMGNLDDAHIDFENLLRHEPSNSDALMMFNRLKKLKENMPQFPMNNAVSDQKITAKISDDSVAHITVPKLYYKLDDMQLSKNYASSECAKVVETNPEAKKSSHIINEMTDEYMLNPCNAKIWFVIELCETIQATHIKIANYELFSSTPKDLTVYFSDVYPALDWKLVGQFTASDSRTLQTFDLNQVGFGKFIRVELHSHYGNEHYCPISEVKVYGNSMVDEYEKSEKTLETNPSVIQYTGKLSRKHKRKTSAYKVYHSMMTQPDTCGLNRSLEQEINYGISTPNPKKPPLMAQPQPTQQPQVVNRTTPLKPSIFVELSNKVKALETSLNLQRNESEKRLEETELKFRKFQAEIKSNLYKLGLIVIAYCVYNLMLDFM